MKRKILLFILIMLSIGIYTFANEIDGNKYTINEDLIKQISTNIPKYTNIDKIPEDLKNAIIAVEDKRFYKHHGFDMIAIGRAFFINIKEGKIKSGGSTITQQLAKNLFLSGERSYKRKLKELLLAIKLESKYSKDEILEMYLNVIYYGSGAYGVQDASETYFSKDVSELSLIECAMLAGLPQAPSAYNPNKYFEKAKRRQKIVLELMAKNGYINKESQYTSQKKIVLKVQ